MKIRILMLVHFTDVVSYVGDKNKQCKKKIPNEWKAIY